MRSPPISRPIDARSSVVAMTFSLPCANAGALDPTATAANIRNAFFIKPLRGPTTLGPYTRSKRVSAMRADRELKLEQKLVRVLPDRIVGPAVLRTDLAELARPVREHERGAGVDEGR